jgi:hypothetical protein
MAVRARYMRTTSGCRGSSGRRAAGRACTRAPRMVATVSRLVGSGATSSRRPFAFGPSPSMAWTASQFNRLPAASNLGADPGADHLSLAAVDALDPAHPVRPAVARDDPSLSASRPSRPAASPGAMPMTGRATVHDTTAAALTLAPRAACGLRARCAAAAVQAGQRTRVRDTHAPCVCMVYSGAGRAAPVRKRRWRTRCGRWSGSAPSAQPHPRRPGRWAPSTRASRAWPLDQLATPQEFRHSRSLRPPRRPCPPPARRATPRRGLQPGGRHGRRVAPAGSVG